MIFQAATTTTTTTTKTTPPSKKNSSSAQLHPILSPIQKCMEHHGSMSPHTGAKVLWASCRSAGEKTRMLGMLSYHSAAAKQPTAPLSHRKDIPAFKMPKARYPKALSSNTHIDICIYHNSYIIYLFNFEPWKKKSESSLQDSGLHLLRYCLTFLL